MRTLGTNPAARRVFWVALAAGLPLALAGAATTAAIPVPEPPPTGGGHVVFVGEPDNTPSYRDEVTGTPVTLVTAGTEVRWVCDGEELHTVTSGIAEATGPDGRFDRGLCGDTPEVRMTFDDPGVYKYYCQNHPMVQHGLLVVA